MKMTHIIAGIFGSVVVLTLGVLATSAIAENVSLHGPCSSAQSSKLAASWTICRFE